MHYTHLHLHTEYSLLDGFNNIKKLAARLKEIDARACGITDHGNMFGVLEFYKTMKANGIKPILGMEAYIHNFENISDKPQKRISPYHLCLFAKNDIGYKNLMYLSSIAYIKGFYNRPRINKNVLKEHSEGLICTSACLAGEIARNLNFNPKWSQKNNPQGYEYSKQAVMWFKEVFGDDFYIEIMRHGLQDELNIDDDLLRLAYETNTKIIATNDAHYATKDEGFYQKIAVKINTNKFDDDIDEGDEENSNIPVDVRMKKRLLSEFYVKSSQEMQEIFADIPQAIENTNEIADKCNLELNLGNATPPNFKFAKDVAKSLNLVLPEPDIEYSLANDSVLFEKMCELGLNERLKFIDSAKHDEYKARLKSEIEIIKNMKFPGYMLIVADFITHAKNQGIPVGPGRGSAAGSLVSYALKITDIDPLPYNLLFERFLNPERISMPDIDVDFCQDRRTEVIKYVVEKYGEYNVAQVATFGKMLAKAVVRDVARVMEVPYKQADDFAKLIPDELGITLTAHKSKSGELKPGAIDKEPKIAEVIEQDETLNKVWQYACQLEGLNRNAGTHAAGVVISNEPLWLKTPLWHPSKNEPWQHATQYSKDYLEEVDLIKFDFLGLKTLTLIDNAKKLIKQSFGKDIIWEEIDFNDAKTYKTIQSGDTLGIFQIESDGMQNLAKKLKPDCFEDIIAMIALYRPGPLDSGMIDDFIDVKHGKKEAHYAFDSLKPILEPTYGVIVYQEQVMQIVQEIGGFSLGGADIVRRAMSKKKEDEMLRIKGQYLEGAKKKGYDETKASELFELIMKFAEYGFNKSHSAAYGLICFQTAYLKTYYPAQFMAALLTSEENNIDKIVKYKEEITRMGYEMIAPSINKSSREFAVINHNGKDAIIFGLAAIKSLGITPIENILKVREKNGEFKDLKDFVSKVDANALTKLSYESMIKSGTFDCFGIPRKTLMQNLEKILESARNVNRAKLELKNSLFADDENFNDIKFQMPSISNVGEYSKKEILEFEKEIIGFYISGNPLDEYKEQISKIPHLLSNELNTCQNSSEVLIIATIEKHESKITKSGSKMHILTLLDKAGSIELTTFDAYNKLDGKGNGPFIFKLKVQNENNEIKLTLIEPYFLDEADNIKLKQNKILPDEISANAEIFATSHTTIQSLPQQNSKECLLIAKILSFNCKTSKSGNEYAFVELMDESSSGEFIAFSSMLEKLSQTSSDKIYGFVISMPKDTTSKPSIQEILESDKIINYKPRTQNRNFNANRNFNQNFNPIAQTMQTPPKIIKELCVNIDLNKLNHDIITQIYALATSQNGCCSLTLSVNDKENSQKFIYKTNYKVNEDFENLINNYINA